MKRNLMRVLSAFLMAVIVSVTFMAPVSYASTVAIGSAVFLVVASALVASGMYFSTDAQLQSAVSHAISVMSEDIYSTVEQVASGLKAVDQNVTEAIAKGITHVGTFSRSSWENFKSWVYDTFSIGTAEADAGKFSLASLNLTGIVSEGFSEYTGFGLPPIYGDQMGASLGYNTFPRSSGVDSGARSMPPLLNIGDLSVFYSRGAIYNEPTSQYHGGYSWKISIRYKGSEVHSMESYDGISWTNGSYGVKYKLFARDNVVYFRYFYRVRNKNSDTVTCYTRSTFEPFGVRNDIVNFDKWAYEHVMPGTADYVNIAVPSDTDVLSAPAWPWYWALTNFDGVDRWVDEAPPVPVDDWDAIKGNVDKALDWVRDICVNPAIASQLDLVEDILDLVAERTRIRDAVAEGAQDVLTDLGRVLEDVRDFTLDIPVDVADIRDTIADLLDRIRDPSIPVDPDIPVDPPDVDVGEIDWSILLGIKVFDKFPFSIPKDVVSFVSALSAPPKEPVFEFDIFGGLFGESGKVTLDLKRFESVRQLVRNGIFIVLVIGLLGASKQYIWTGGG